MSEKYLEYYSYELKRNFGIKVPYDQLHNPAYRQRFIFLIKKLEHQFRQIGYDIDYIGYEMRARLLKNLSKEHRELFDVWYRGDAKYILKKGKRVRDIRRKVYLKGLARRKKIDEEGVGIDKKIYEIKKFLRFIWG